MARTSTYLNFMGNTEQVFRFYADVFGTEIGPLSRLGDAPAAPDAPLLSDAEQQMVMHVTLPILGGHVLMGTDALESQGHRLKFGNTMHLNLEPDTRAEAERLFTALSVGGKVGMPLTEMFWGAVFGTVTDRFGVSWMINATA
jgi:PhnB protein